MNKFLFLIFCVALFFAASGQATYADAIRQGDAAFNSGQYKLAINKYFAAEAFDTSKKKEVKEKKKLTFDKIDKLRQDAIRSQNDATNALAEVEKQKMITD